MSRFLNILPLALLIAICLIAVLSWIGSVYGWDCRNVLSADGLRWSISRFMIHLNNAPWEYVIMLTATISVITESSIVSNLAGSKNLKQKRAYMTVAVIIAVLILATTILSLLPGNILMSAFGTFSNSALQHGLFPIAVLMVYGIAVIYGYATGRFYNLRDIYSATVSLPVRISTYFITLFVTSQLVSLILYVFYTDYHPGLERPFSITAIAFCLYWIPWMLHVYIAYKDKS